MQISKEFVFLAMLFCHVLDDYGLQVRILSSLKQKSWWNEHAPDKLYKYDYLTALLMHCISWSFMVMLPVAVYHGFDVHSTFVFLFCVNVVVHAVTDHVKANKRLINLVVDQMFHVIQIIMTFDICINYGRV